VIHERMLKGFSRRTNARLGAVPHAGPQLLSGRIS
jgi:hypothetical protein